MTENNMKNPTIKYEIEHKIKEIRILRGLSREQLASILGTTKENLYQMETGRRNIAITWLSKLADALKCTRSQLLGEAPIEGIEEVEIQKPDPSTINNEIEHKEKYIEDTVEIMENFADDKKLGRYNKVTISPYLYKVISEYNKSSDKDIFVTDIEKDNIAKSLFLDFLSKKNK